MMNQVNESEQLRPEPTAQNVSLCPAYYLHRCELDNTKCHSGGQLYSFFCEKQQIAVEQIHERYKDKKIGHDHPTKA